MSKLSTFVVESTETGSALVCRLHSGWWMKLDGLSLDVINKAAREHVQTHTDSDPGLARG